MTNIVALMPLGQLFVADKTPAEIDDWTINWADRGLGADVIATSSWQVNSSDLSINSSPPTSSNTTATVWLSGGIAGTPYLITNTVTTQGGRQYEETFVCNCIQYRMITL